MTLKYSTLILTVSLPRELTDICNIVKCQVLVLTESKCDQSIPDFLLTIPSFHPPLRRDRTRHGGGVLCYISDNLTFRQRTEMQHVNYEHVFVDVYVNKQVYAVNALYRPSTQQSAEDHAVFLSTMEEILFQMQDHPADVKVFSSDMNFGNIFCKQPLLDPKPLDSSAPELFQSFGYTQLLDIPTRTTETTTSLIDLIFVDNLDNMTGHGTIPKVADHDGTFVTFHCNTIKTKLRKKIIYDYTNINHQDLKDYIKSINFDNLIFSKPLTQQTEILTQFLVEAFAKFVPTKEVTIREHDQPWTNTYTRLLLRKKNRNYSFFQKSFF